MSMSELATCWNNYCDYELNGRLPVEEDVHEFSAYYASTYEEYNAIYALIAETVSAE